LIASQFFRAMFAEPKIPQRNVSAMGKKYTKHGTGHKQARCIPCAYPKMEASHWIT
jgi:hypothetical protein